MSVLVVIMTPVSWVLCPARPVRPRDLTSESLRSTVTEWKQHRRASRCAGDGRIPFTLRIGVTGHRDLADPDALRPRIREAIVWLLTLVPVAPRAGLALVVVSRAGTPGRAGHPR